MKQFIPINESVIQHQLPQDLYKFYIKQEIDSTNKFLKDITPEPGKVSVCIAESQSAGKGRFGRTWHSPFGKNIYLSMRFQLRLCPAKLSGIGLIVGLAILNALKHIPDHKEMQIKWPNDILWRDKKLCGVLIELINQTNNTADIIIGIGINVNMKSNAAEIDRPWCSLYEITGKLFDRNLLIADLILSVTHYITTFLANDFSFFMPEWEQKDYLFDKYTSVNRIGVVLNGYANGVNNLGQLKLIDEGGVEHYLSSGEASILRFVPD